MKSRLLPAFALAAAVALPTACSSPPAEAPAAPAAETRDPGEWMALGEKAGIHNFAEIAPGLFRGAQPEGEPSFAFLASIGVKTLLSVDGARPDAEAAARHGMRYVHVPMEYRAVTGEEQVKFAKVARDLPGPVFVHCHHGKHRGPAASGILWMARDGVPPEKAIADMRVAGTDPAYEGLYRDVANFKAPPAAALDALTEADLPPAVAVPDMIEAMVALDASYVRMKAVRKAAWGVPPKMPDVRPAHEARILAEHFRETARLEEVGGKPEDFRRWLAEGEQAAWDLEKALRAGDTEAAATSLERVTRSCNVCHDEYRNKARVW